MRLIETKEPNMLLRHKSRLSNYPILQSWNLPHADPVLAPDVRPTRDDRLFAAPIQGGQN